MRANDFLYKLAYALQMQQEEKDHWEKCFNQARKALTITLPYVQDVIQIGSLSKGTCLPRWTGRVPDIDCLLLLDDVMYDALWREARATKEEYYWQKRVLSDLTGFAEKVDVLSEAPFVTFKFGGINIDCVITSAAHPRTVMIPKRLSAWERDNFDIWHEKYLGPGIAEGRPREGFLLRLNPLRRRPAPRRVIVFSDPMKYTNALPQLDEKCGEFWRHLILLWKFSCFVEKSNLSSYVIEYNVFETIAETTTLAGEHALLDAVALFFRYPAINRDPLLNKDPGFKKLRHAIDRAANLSRKSKQTGPAICVSDRNY